MPAGGTHGVGDSSILRSLHGLPAVRPCRSCGAFRACGVAVNVSRERMKVSPVMQLPKAGSLASPLRRGIREDPGRDQLYTCILAPESRTIVCVRGRLPRMIADQPLCTCLGPTQQPSPCVSLQISPPCFSFLFFVLFFLSSYLSAFSCL